MPTIDGLDAASEPCELCGYHYGELHRLVPGCWGGSYSSENCMWLCPNHHRAIHFMMAWYYCNAPGGPDFPAKPTELADSLEHRLCIYQAEKCLRDLWIEHAKPAIRARLIDEGRYHPYVRTLPDEPRYAIPR